MSSLIDKIEKLIKREKSSPDRKNKDEITKSSNEILTELFGAFNAAPPEIEEVKTKRSKSKKSKKKHKKEKKKRSRSSSSSSSDSERSSSRKRKKKKKSKKRKVYNDSSDEDTQSKTPPRIKPDPELIKKEVKHEKKEEKPRIKDEPRESRVTVKTEGSNDLKITVDTIDASSIPMPESPKDSKLDNSDLRLKLDGKNKIQIKNLKFSSVFEETLKKVEEEAKKKAEKYEDGEVTDSSHSSDKEEISNSNFPKSSDPGGILKKKEHSENDSRKRSSRKSSRRDRSRSRRRSHSRSKRSRSRSNSRRKRHTSRSTSRSRHRSRSTSRSRHKSGSLSRHRSSHRSRSRHRSKSPYHSSRVGRSFRSRISPRRIRRSSRSPSGVKLADSEKKRLLEVARRNAINMLKNGAVPAGAAALPPHTRSQVMAAIQSGGKSVDELTDFCKHLSKKEALGELSSVSSNGSDMSENEDTLAFHHPFLVKEKAPIVMNIRGGAPLPVKTNPLPIANKEELRLQFPVSSGSQHRTTEWVPVSPKDDEMPIVKLNHKPPKSTPAAEKVEKAPPPALPAPPAPVPAPPTTTLANIFTPGAQLLPTASVLPTLPPPGPQAYPPGIKPPPAQTTKPNISAIVAEKLLMIRKAQEQNESASSTGFGWSAKERLGQFTGSTGAQILTPRELASGTQAWAKKDQLQRAAPVAGGMGMHLLQKMGWTPGQGLGKEGTGTLQPLLLEVKMDTKGLTAREEAGVRANKMKARSLQTAIRRGGGGGGGSAAASTANKHPVSLLGEYCSKNKLGPPEYELCFECGPDHKKNFLFKVKIAGIAYQPTVASQNKKQAKADAAQLALQKLGIMT